MPVHDIVSETHLQSGIIALGGGRLKWPFISDTADKPCTFIVQDSRKTEIQGVNMTVLLKDDLENAVYQ